ncbi:MAG: 50S ribosomal protein L25/general stress protein Ctc [Bacteroidaceae bacterium]|jgi:large subunit ribosomal protein L25|nr:50S ribosomal protein L25/general stress protein Ctc [Bacteroidaceae bacterium]MBR3633074.1 50S ribosomal protein L25/general stress protein Ctc [Bacteroidaceae bacterium]MBR3733345.1 50S ribosomal protein L25/general stress protein Ctc [Bacteroidaceae bacterium]MBR4649822.1 50S ribosomal protein L25/general stress protein Ctc [Bacteroidaceae bacterium]MDO4951240.1 50S ribosomal protein L25/general stress protein Ctc [Bacteroidales bacterium]
MKTFELKGTARVAGGKRAAKILRATGAIPCNLYGVEKDADGKAVATSFSVTFEAVRKLIYTPEIFVVNLDIDGKVCKAVMRELQFHPVKDNVLHIDFYQITDDKPIVMAVPVTYSGHAVGVREGGAFRSLIRNLKVKATYDKIPERLDIDITELGIGKSIIVGDLDFEGLEIVTPKQALVCTVKATRNSKSADEEEGEATEA